MKNKPINLDPHEIIIAVQSLYVERVSRSIETCFEIVRDFVSKGTCMRAYRKRCQIIKSTVYKELLNLVPYNDRKMYDANQETFGIDNLNFPIHALRVYRNNRLQSVIDLTNNKTLYDVERGDDESVIYNQMISNVEQDFFKNISTIILGLQNKETKEFFNKHHFCYGFDGLCTDLADGYALEFPEITNSYHNKYPNVEVQIDISLLSDIYKMLITNTENTEPVLLASNTDGDNLYIKAKVDDDKRYCEMYIDIDNGKTTSNVKVENSFDMFFIFNTLIGSMNDMANINKVVNFPDIKE